jgi:long-chain acyl-CoA synthetase
MERLTSKMGWDIVEEEWPDFKGRIYKQRSRSLVEMLEKTVEKYPDHVGFISGDVRMTFSEFDQVLNRIAAGLHRIGVKQGERVALLLGIDIDFPSALFAVMKLGAIGVPLNTRFKGEELAYEINDSESKVLIVDEEYWSYIDSVRDRLKTVEKIYFNGPSIPDGADSFRELRDNNIMQLHQTNPNETDAALILYTSGTTGKPKGAILHHRGLIATAMHVSDFIALRQGDKLLCCVPLFHITGLAMVVLSSIFAGIPCVYVRTFKVKDFLETMASEKVTKIVSVINVIWLMVNHADFDKHDFNSFEVALLGGSPATEEMVHGIKAKLPHLNVSVGYGLTEGHGYDTSTPYEDAFRKITGVGKLLPLVDARICDDNGNEVPVGEIGEIMLKSAKITKGYWKNEKATKASITVDGWLHTGDIGKFDEEGFLYLLDRKKDMINRGGEKIYSLELENVIFNYPKVLDAAVVGVPDKIMGEAVKAVIVFKPGETATADEIKEFCARHLADYKVPKFVEFMDSIPRNPAGKVMKDKLRYLPGAQAGGSTPAESGA